MVDDSLGRPSLGIDISGRVELHGGSYVAFCNEVPLVGASATAGGAMDSLLRCLKSYVDYNERFGVLDAVIKDYGFVEAGQDGIAGFWNFSLPKVAAGGPAAVG